MTSKPSPKWSMAWCLDTCGENAVGRCPDSQRTVAEGRGKYSRRSPHRQEEPNTHLAQPLAVDSKSKLQIPISKSQIITTRFVPLRLDKLETQRSQREAVSKPLYLTPSRP